MTTGVCEHGQLARSCEACEELENVNEMTRMIQSLTDLIAEKNAENAALRAEVALLKRSLDVMARDR